MDGSLSVDEVCQDNTLLKIDVALKEKKEFLKSFRTAKLWFDVLRKYIRAECTGNWELHLQAVSEMLPYLAASGHNNYTKSATYVSSTGRSSRCVQALQRWSACD